MKDSTIAAIFLGITLALVVGGLVGYAIATDQIHKQAIANRAGHNAIVNGYAEFVWGEPTN